MGHRTKYLLAAICLFFSHSQMLAQHPNYTGTWILNLEKSKLEHMPEGLTTSKFIIKQDGNKFKLTRYHIIGEKQKKISFKMTADGKTRRIKILFKGKLEWKENNLLASIWRKKFSNIVSYSFGANENEFIADEVMNSKANKHHNIWVFEREVEK